MSGMTGRRVVRLMAAAAGGAVVAGIVVGGAARLLMSLIAIAAAEQSQFSLMGTVGVFIAFTVLAVPAAVTGAAPRVVRVAGRWVTAAVTGFGVASTGFADGAAVILAPDGRMTYIAMVVVGFGAVVVAHGLFAQYVTRRLAGAPS
ncbi:MULTISPECIES: hypothetical protein [Nonomuraea]|uniref:Fluoride ion transporter CrcB n=1 Tax=Nonomuraea ferruginea TaxID=46174 RepID=A0ABT4T315_9ACTN|nr:MULTISPECIES: hypothetical protein [Nonomuraea]MDA0643799.1 hypothetical protein [Nonomuraea ferruginea]TXK34337.1 hypothetical protein FR742_33770 [Nonomuraea sp. C10]